MTTELRLITGLIVGSGLLIVGLGMFKLKKAALIVSGLTIGYIALLVFFAFVLTEPKAGLIVWVGIIIALSVLVIVVREPKR